MHLVVIVSASSEYGSSGIILEPLQGLIEVRGQHFIGEAFSACLGSKQSCHISFHTGNIPKFTDEMLMLS